MSDSNQPQTAPSPVVDSVQTQTGANNPAAASTATPGQVGAPQAPQQAPAAEPSPLSFKDMIIEAYKLSRKNTANLMRAASLIQGIAEKTADTEDTAMATKAEVISLKKQLAAIYKLTEEGKPLTSENVATLIVKEEQKAMKAQLDQALADKTIAPITSIAKDTDIVWFSYKDGGSGYQSVASYGEQEFPGLVGKKAGDTIKDATIEAIYELVPKSQPETQGGQDGQNQTAQTSSTTSPTAQGDSSTQPQTAQTPLPAPTT